MPYRFNEDSQAQGFLEGDHSEEQGAYVSGLLAVAAEQRVANMLKILEMGMDVFGDLPPEAYEKRRELIVEYLQEYVSANVG